MPRSLALDIGPVSQDRGALQIVSGLLPPRRGPSRNAQDPPSLTQPHLPIKMRVVLVREAATSLNTLGRGSRGRARLEQERNLLLAKAQGFSNNAMGPPRRGRDP